VDTPGHDRGIASFNCGGHTCGDGVGGVGVGEKSVEVGIRIYLEGDEEVGFVRDVGENKGVNVLVKVA